jgi:acetyl esterase
MVSRFWSFSLLSLFSSVLFSTTASGISTYTNVEFSRVAGVPLVMDAAVPRGEGPFPAVIMVHGGAWVRGDRRVDVQPLFAPLSEAGFGWFSIDYRLMTDITQFGAAVGDVEAAINFVRARAAEFRIDPKRIALLGESAGGQLAAIAALNEAPDFKVRGVVALYAPTDLLALAQHSPFLSQWVHDNLLGSPLLISARLKQLSPIERVTRDMPPFLLIHGTADPLVPFEQSLAMCDRMTVAGAPCELYAVKGAGHGMRWWSNGSSEGYQREMVRWLRERLHT